MSTPDFVRGAVGVQPLVVRAQGPYIAFIQWDGTGEHQHWALVHSSDVESLVECIREAAAECSAA